ncbi:hypothetical protein CsSME_00014300 [Camellia sinensis var. sinensis]
MLTTLCFAPPHKPLVIQGLLAGYDTKPIGAGLGHNRVVSEHKLYYTHNANVEIIPIVHEFPNVFPNDLLGELIDREIEFTIDAVSRTQTNF